MVANDWCFEVNVGKATEDVLEGKVELCSKKSLYGEYALFQILVW